MLALKYQEKLLEVGTDEAGRGCLSGPVFAAAVILPNIFFHPLLNDSKQLSEKQRQILRPYIEEHAIAYAVSYVFQEKIDEINILQASILAMHQSIDQLETVPEFIIVDGNKFNPYKDILHKTIVKGDAKFMSIAAASVLAKTYRDEYMIKINDNFPEYNWKKNKGYPTKEHRNAIREFGITKHHRKSFRLLPEQLKLDI
jgi:ribonuclease HII|uniref:Ribonuclease HII n=1 Tax=uncultured Flavobacteriia bacterium TaxID=212695 RepID=H6RE69_9BACT|nr:ribonuclease HII [uncultured bacterium]AOE12629.1 ribonuclease HII [uncultured bacterium]CCF99330.1 Ribonuclease HII [uncultured Flavobacteriia bacterium]|tara:strand:+ start:21962 stop:22561 length:600 start_codon:yes stop_codon:yes gene_type:complete